MVGVSDGRAMEQTIVGQVTGWRARDRLAIELGARQGGVVSRAQLRERGITDDQVRSMIRSGRWVRGGRHTVMVGGRRAEGVAALWQAVWEGGSGGALHGSAALVGHGLTGLTLDRIDVVVPRSTTRHPQQLPHGVRVHRPRHAPELFPVGIPRVRPEEAMIAAAQWARSDREAVLMLCLPLQQRLVAPARVAAAWATVERGPRRRLLGAVVCDLTDGARSLGELDFGRLVSAVGLPPPSRQVVRQGPGGRVYLDAAWEQIGLVAEIDGGHHLLALNLIEDALRQNDVSIGGELVLRIPVVGLRLCPEAFLAQLLRAYRRLLARAA